MLLLICCLSACSLLPTQRVEVQTKYIQTPPTLLEAPVPPILSNEQVIVITNEDARYYSEACEAFREDLEGAAIEYQGLDEISACRWSIFGFTLQGWYNLQQDLILIQNYVDHLRTQRNFYEEQLIKRGELDAKP